MPLLLSFGRNGEQDFHEEKEKTRRTRITPLLLNFGKEGEQTVKRMKKENKDRQRSAAKAQAGTDYRQIAPSASDRQRYAQQ